MEPKSFCDATIEGLAPDGGLIVPEKYPIYSIKDLKRIKDLSYQELAMEILGKFADDIPAHELEDIISRTYNKKIFGTQEITPIISIGDKTYIQDLAGGPTLAFKDVALQFLGNTFEYILKSREDFLNVLLASSGDTFTAAIASVIGKEYVNIFALTPYNKMSPFQTAQGYTINEPNVHNIAVVGVFDDCQDLVKIVIKDDKFKKKHHLGAMNSINWARIAAQVVYYFKGYFKVSDYVGEKVDFSVPTGNFGNILAGHIAKQMGLPIRNLILATNENNVLDIFFSRGIYKSWRTEDVKQTSSPSMDISKASNIERFFYDLLGKDPEETRKYMEEFEKEGSINLKYLLNEMREKYGFVSGTSRENDRIETIKNIYLTYGVITDPHTANGVKVGLDYKQKWNDNTKLICLSTAKPTKFEDTIFKALGFIPERSEKFRDIEKKEHFFDLMKDKNDVQWLKNYIEKHSLYNQFKK